MTDKEAVHAQGRDGGQPMTAWEWPQWAITITDPIRCFFGLCREHLVKGDNDHIWRRCIRCGESEQVVSRKVLRAEMKRRWG